LIIKFDVEFRFIAVTYVIPCLMWHLTKKKS